MSEHSRKEELEIELHSLSKRNDNPILRQLIDILREKDVLPSELLSITGLTRETLFSGKGHLHSSRGKWSPLPVERAALFYLMLKFKPERLLLDPAREEAWLRQFPITESGALKTRDRAQKKHFTHAFWASIKQYWALKEMPYDNFYHIPHTHPGTNAELTTAYRNIRAYFVEAKQSISVQELLFKGNNALPGKARAYPDAQALIHRAIAENLQRHAGTKKRVFRYERIFYLSPSERLYPKGTDEETAKRAFAAEASLETLRHVYTCLRDFPGLCRFAVVVQASVFRHRSIIDNHYMIIEDYVCDGSDSIVPERIYTLDVGSNSRGKDLIEYEQERMHKNLSASRSWELTLEDLPLYIYQAMDYAVEEIESRSVAIDILINSPGEHGRLTRQLKETKRRYENHHHLLLSKQEEIERLRRPNEFSP